MRYLIDAMELGHNPKGISRVLEALTPRIVSQASNDVFVACTSEGAQRLRDVPGNRIITVRRHVQSHWEQLALPMTARRIGASAVYSHRESGAIWGPPLVLHVPEDPEVRWSRTSPDSARGLLRLVYSRMTMRLALRRSVAAASSTSVAIGLSERYGIPLDSIRIIPLGVDLTMFTPAQNPAADTIFHLGSTDPRDRTPMVVDAWVEARRRDSTLPRLVIGGTLGDLTDDVRRRAGELAVEVELTGRLTDAELVAHLQHAAVVVQPSSDEGFGLQPLEAMACGAPLVVTRDAAVLEVVGDAAIVADGTADALSSGIVYALREAGRLRAGARARAKLYSWERCAEATLAALGAAAQ